MSIIDTVSIKNTCYAYFCFDIFSVENIVPAGFDGLSDGSIIHGSAL